jgi:hypothetical protein
MNNYVLKGENGKVILHFNAMGVAGALDHVSSLVQFQGFQGKYLSEIYDETKGYITIYLPFGQKFIYEVEESKA